MNEITEGTNKSEAMTRFKPPKRERKRKLRFGFVVREEEKVELESLQSEVLHKLNTKEKGSEITPGDLYLYLLRKMSDQDAQELQRQSLNLWDKIDIEREAFNQKNDMNLTLEEFISKKMKIQ